MVPWARTVNTTLKNYIREREVNILRNRKLTALLKSKGRITFGWSGTEMEWRVRYKRAPLTPYEDGDTLTFSPKDRHKVARLGWRGYSQTDSIRKFERLQNRNDEAIINTYSEVGTMLMDDMEDAFGEELYLDGNLPANQKRLHGIESFLGASANAGNGAGTPNDEFAGLSTVPGAYGGAWSSTVAPNAWPNGRGDAQYDFWSPVVVDYTDTLFSATATWAANCVEAVAYAIIKSKKNKSTKGMLDMLLLEEELYRIYLSVQRSKEQINVNRGQQSGLVALGFTDVINQDGTDITWEYGMPSAVGYGFNCDEMELRSMQDQLFVPEGPDYDISTKAWRFSIDFFGNCVWNPKFFCALKNL